MTPAHGALLIVEAIDVAALCGLMLIAAGFLTLPALYLFQRGARPAAAGDGELADPPVVLAQLPVFNEPQVVAGLLDCVASLEWPADRLHIQLVDDSTDETSDVAAAKIAELRLRGMHVEHLRRVERTGFKAGALAVGLARSQAPVLAVLDADFRPPRGWLKAVVPRLLADPTAGFVQSRCEFANADRNWLTRAQGLMMDCHFVMEQGVRARAGLPIQFNGTAAVWRREAIDAGGGWLGHSLSEDLDLALRARLAGWRGLFAHEPAVPGLVPHRIDHWRTQQRRWSMGFAQNARVLAARIWRSDLGLAERLSVEFLLFYQLALPLILIAVLAGAIDVAAGCPDLGLMAPLWGLTAVLTLAVALGMTLPPYLELRRGGMVRYFAAVAAIPPLVILLAFNNALSVVLGLFGRAGVFHRTPKPASEALERH